MSSAWLGRSSRLCNRDFIVLGLDGDEDDAQRRGLEGRVREGLARELGVEEEAARLLVRRAHVAHEPGRHVGGGDVARPHEGRQRQVQDERRRAGAAAVRRRERRLQRVEREAPRPRQPEVRRGLQLEHAEHDEAQGRPRVVAVERRRAEAVRVVVEVRGRRVDVAEHERHLRVARADALEVPAVQQRPHEVVDVGGPVLLEHLGDLVARGRPREEHDLGRARRVRADVLEEGLDGEAAPALDAGAGDDDVAVLARALRRQAVRARAGRALALDLDDLDGRVGEEGDADADEHEDEDAADDRHGAVVAVAHGRHGDEREVDHLEERDVAHLRRVVDVVEARVAQELDGEHGPREEDDDADELERRRRELHAHLRQPVERLAVRQRVRLRDDAVDAHVGRAQPGRGAEHRGPLDQDPGHGHAVEEEVRAADVVRHAALEALDAAVEEHDDAPGDVEGVDRRRRVHVVGLDDPEHDRRARREELRRHAQVLEPGARRRLVVGPDPRRQQLPDEVLLEELVGVRLRRLLIEDGLLDARVE
jgi:hypothetical protein